MTQKSVRVVQHGDWSFAGGSARSLFVVLVDDRVWGSYCYSAQAEQVAGRLTGRENVSNFPTLAEYDQYAWQAD